MTQATSGIAALIARIKQDGVEAGEQAGAERRGQAEREAAEIIARARAEAAQITAAAKQDAQERAERLDGELRMAARDFVFRFHERLRAQVIEPLARDAAASALGDPARTAALVVDLVRGWGDGQGGRVHADPALRAALQAALGARVAERAAAGGVVLVDEAGLAGFRLVREGEHFVWDVSAETVARELADLVEPGLRTLLAPAKPRPASGSYRVVPADGQA